MRYLIDFQHPADLLFFRNVIERLRREDHTVFLTGWHKDILVDLARESGYSLEVFGRSGKGVAHLAKELVYRQAKLTSRILRFKPHAMLAIAGTFISIPGWLLRVPTYVFYDTEHATISNLLSYPFATCTYVPRCYRKEIRWRHERYAGYHELAYLAPKYFQPDVSVLEQTGLKPGERFSVVRFVGWGAAHDIGLRGFSLESKIRAVGELSRFGRVFISSEAELPPELEEYRYRLPVNRVHHLMAYASLIFGESATMASEGAVLGVPAVYLDPVGRGYTDEQEREFGMVFNFTHKAQDAAINKAVEILAGYPTDEWAVKRQRMLEGMIDVTDLVYTVAVERPHTRAGASPL